MTYAVINFCMFVVGAVLLSLAFGWQIGCGVAALVYFHKHAE